MVITTRAQNREGQQLLWRIDKEQSAQTARLHRRNTAATGLLGAFILLLAVTSTRKISRPLTRLQKGAEIIGAGNLDYKVSTGARDEIGQLSSAIDEMTASLRKVMTSRDELNREVTERRRAEEGLKKTLAEIRTLQGILPICSYCKKIRDDEGSWRQMEIYIRDHSDAEFSHGICPDCAVKVREELEDFKRKNRSSPS